jgi:hypothetical protein
VHLDFIKCYFDFTMCYFSFIDFRMFDTCDIFTILTIFFLPHVDLFAVSASYFPVGRLVLERAKVPRLTRSDLVRRLGYESLNGGQAALTNILMTGSQSPTIAPRLAEALEVEPDLLDQVSMATARQQHDEARAQILERERAYRAAFRPHLQIQTERRVPSPIFLAALLGTARLRIVWLTDETFSAGDADRDRIVKAVILQHYRERWASAGIRDDHRLRSGPPGRLRRRRFWAGV